jgi:hypothetical protein
LVTKKAKDKPFESDNRKLKKRRAEVALSGGGVQLGPLYRFQIRESKRNRACRACLCAGVYDSPHV